jgi:hypothetical protein
MSGSEKFQGGQLLVDPVLRWDSVKKLSFFFQKQIQFFQAKNGVTKYSDLLNSKCNIISQLAVQRKIILAQHIKVIKKCCQQPCRENNLLCKWPERYIFILVGIWWTYNFYP